MKLYLVQCGYYDYSLFGGSFKTYIHFLICSSNFSEARSKTMQMPEFRGKQVEVISIHEIEAVSGHRIFLAEDKTLFNKTLMHSMTKRDRPVAVSSPAPTAEERPQEAEI